MGVRMSKKILYEGPDISKHQGNVNIKAIRDAGYKRIGIRAGYGKNNVDQKYIVNAEACYNLGVPVLLYWFSYAYTVAMAAAEAVYAITQARKYWKRCPIAFDLEYDSISYARKNGVNITKAMATDMAIAFLKEVRDAGYIPVLYTNRDYLRNYFDMDRITAQLGTVILWYARYSDAIPAAELEAADVWQYTSKGRIPGVAGNVDLNRFYIDFGEDGLGEDKPVDQEDKEKKCNLNIQNFQKAANGDGYRDQDGRRLAEDGIDGPKTRYVRGRIILKARWTVLGYKAGSSGSLVRWVQERLKEMGYDLTVDGKYGKATRSAVIRFQKDHNLDRDGIAGYNTIQMMFYN